MVSMDFNISDTDSLNISVVSYANLLWGIVFSVGRIVGLVMAHVCCGPGVDKEERRVVGGTSFT